MIYREGEVLERIDTGSEVQLVARMPLALRGRLKQTQGVVVEDSTTESEAPELLEMTE